MVVSLHSSVAAVTALLKSLVKLFPLLSGDRACRMTLKTPQASLDRTFGFRPPPQLSGWRITSASIPSCSTLAV